MRTAAPFQEAWQARSTLNHDRIQEHSACAGASTRGTPPPPPADDSRPTGTGGCGGPTEPPWRPLVGRRVRIVTPCFLASHRSARAARTSHRRCVESADARDVPWDVEQTIAGRSWA